MTNSLSRFGIASLLFWMTSVAGSAAAEPTPEIRAAAEVLFTDALKLIDAADLAGACPKLAESQRLDPQMGTLLYLATCHEQLGRSASAWAEFKEALALAQASGKADRIAQAEAGVARVEPTLSKLRLVVTGIAPDQKVFVNDREQRVFDLEIPYDPGPLVVRAEAPGRRGFSQKLELGKGPLSETMTVPELALSEQVAPPPAKAPDHTLAYVVGGAGLGVTALGLAFGGVALAEKGAADDLCDGSRCSQQGLDGHDSANAWAWASNITTGVGLVALGVGVVLFFVDGGGETTAAPGSEQTARSGLGLRPWSGSSEHGGFVTGVLGVF